MLKVVLLIYCCITRPRFIQDENADEEQNVPQRVQHVKVTVENDHKGTIPQTFGTRFNSWPVNNDVSVNVIEHFGYDNE